jgi:hypothetical protein
MATQKDEEPEGAAMSDQGNWCACCERRSKHCQATSPPVALDDGWWCVVTPPDLHIHVASNRYEGTGPFSC